MGFTEFQRFFYYWVLPSFMGFYWVLLGFTRFYWVLLGFTGFYWVLLGSTGFCPGTRTPPCSLVETIFDCRSPSETVIIDGPREATKAFQWRECELLELLRGTIPSSSDRLASASRPRSTRTGPFPQSAAQSFRTCGLRGIETKPTGLGP